LQKVDHYGNSGMILDYLKAYGRKKRNAPAEHYIIPDIAVKTVKNSITIISCTKEAFMECLFSRDMKHVLGKNFTGPIFLE
jgi:hypothetical protein